MDKNIKHFSTNFVLPTKFLMLSLKMLEKAYDLFCFSRSSTSSTDGNVDKVKEMVMENRHSSLKEMTQDLDISHESVRIILVDVLDTRRVAVRFVPKELNFLQKEHRNRFGESDRQKFFLLCWYTCP
ncbi:PREDICTED: uncharacterized protein LOC106751397 [Dinoponera quadriceps]|uniref:Uncharacterized protein LOC106751397 n=1 Tax=Dinoponera quadriceps TaxID=609295 RepID=A0A6P3Y9S2_DINQU|nr:PREDICTED: uncharacterized protein LOC106751397 [Dinoponera quadriceps]